MSFNYDRYDRRQPAARTRSTFGYCFAIAPCIGVGRAQLTLTAIGCP